MVANSQHEATATSEANASANATAGATATPIQKRDVYLTGFGRFGDILENPTTLLARKLAEHPKVTESHVLEVSAESKTTTYRCAISKVLNNESNTRWLSAVLQAARRNSLRCTQGQRAQRFCITPIDQERGRPCIFLHFGVAATSRSIKLEQVGYNVADFRIPDERGYVATNEIIHEGEPSDISTNLPLEEMLATLQAVHPRVDLSDDPGRYICNFVYYRSLVWAKHQETKGNQKHFALFVHFPEFRNVVFEDQMAVASKIVDLYVSLDFVKPEVGVAYTTYDLTLFLVFRTPVTDTSNRRRHPFRLPTASGVRGTRPSTAKAPTAMSAQQTNVELKEAIKRQVEFYFSRANLTNDAYLVSQMNSQMYVPVEVIVNFSKIKQLTDNTALLVEAVQDSDVCSLNSAKDAIKPNIKSERTTIILREIPSSTKPEDVEAIFDGCGKVASVRSDVGDTWFVTMNSESEAVSTLLALRSKTFNGAAIKARLKSENVLKSFYPTQPAENVIAPSVGAPYGGRGYYASPNMGYYDNYGVQYNTVNPRAGQHNNYNNGAERYAGNNQRGGAVAGRGQGRQNRSNGTGTHQQKETRAKSGSFEQRGPGSARKNKDKRTKAEKQANGSANGKKAAAPAERQPVMNAANFPPLPTAQEKGEVSNVITYKYHHEDIMEIVKNMDENDCMLPEGKMDYAVHPAALTPEAHPDLLRNQRTYSIEQARDAMRQGRPIRSDSVGSIDYESMMYGEDYTKEAREQRKQKAESTPAPADSVPAAKSAASPKSTKPAAVPAKAVGYAAAVINGTPAPTPAPEPKKKQPAAKTAAKTSSKDEKKTAKKTGKTAESASKEAAAPAVDESLPKTGAWGGRNFLDVVKADPPAAPVQATATASASESESK
ncbi:La-related protein 4 [Phytophthora citrophthora]|uniref:La-related protein 4 n=1 Tax=Phytophthora citrophthora TaxID=4793 RepID=A0AAD9H1Q6_9STRA|nr:La-related protein 4 [Phytophthora citrophthora]